MKKVKLMKKYANLIATIGIRAHSGQNVVIQANVEMSEFVHYLVKELYNQKVKHVDVVYTDQILIKQKLMNSSLKRASEIDEFYVQRMEERAKQGYARILLDGDDPMVFQFVPSEKLKAYNYAFRSATYPFRRIYNSNELAWCIAGVPTKQWASRVFKDDSPTQALAKLWKAVYKACRIEEDNDPISEWNEHVERMKRNASLINDMKLVSLHYKNSLGTDLTIKLPKNYRFTGANNIQKINGRGFVPNIPTEEIFASPRLDGVDGIVYSSKLLNYHGIVIDKFFLKFKDGKVIDFGAETGYEALKGIIEFDEGSCRLGECALIPYHSPISELGIVFLSTLFDENASCHLALGASFNECIENGENMSEEELTAAGLNSSKEHVDFMIGTKDLQIDGIDEEGHTHPIFVDGDFAF